MKWLRRHIRMGFWPALFALGLQFVLAFGHIHAEDLRPATQITPVALHLGGSGTQPGDDDHDGVGHDFCAICAAVALTSSSVLPPIPVVVAPMESYRVQPVEFRNSELLYETRLNFQARGPPILI